MQTTSMDIIRLMSDLRGRPEDGRSATVGSDAVPMGQRSDTPAGRVFYFGVGNLRSPSAGLDKVTRLHWQELVSSGLELEGFVVEPDAAKPAHVAVADNARLHIFPPAAGAGSGLRNVGRKVRSLFTPHALLRGMTLGNSAAAAAARLRAAENLPDLVVIDHLYALQNVPLSLLLSKRVRVVFISHDYTPLLMRDLYSDSHNVRSKVAFRSDLAKAVMLERLLMRRADRAIFLSDRDLAHYGESAGKAMALLPFEERDDPPRPAFTPSSASGGGEAPYLVFVGSPGFLPNAYAIEWICKRLSPSLWAAAPDCQIVLVGKGTKTIAGACPNVVGKGFASDEELERILLHSQALLSPIEHGSGLKIKILDAITLGVPVMATRRALQGFGAFDMPLVIDVERPDDAAALITKLLDGRIDGKALRDSLQRQVAQYRSDRKGRIASVLRELLRNRS